MRLLGGLLCVMLGCFVIYRFSWMSLQKRFTVHNIALKRGKPSINKHWQLPHINHEVPSLSHLSSPLWLLGKSQCWWWNTQRWSSVQFTAQYKYSFYKQLNCCNLCICSDLFIVVVFIFWLCVCVCNGYSVLMVRENFTFLLRHLSSISILYFASELLFVYQNDALGLSNLNVKSF